MLEKRWNESITLEGVYVDEWSRILLRICCFFSHPTNLLSHVLDHQLQHIEFVNPIPTCNCTLVHLHLLVTLIIVTVKRKLNDKMSYKIDSNCQGTSKVKRIPNFLKIHSRTWLLRNSQQALPILVEIKMYIP